MNAKIITIAQQKGGAGKSTVVAHFASRFLQLGKSVTIIDIDPQASLGAWSAIRNDQLGEENNLINYSSISGWRLHSEISRVSKDHDIVLIDSPPHTQTETKTAVRVADIVIVPMQPSPTDMWATKETVEIIKKERIPYRILLNRVVRNTKIATRVKFEFSNLMESSLGNRIIYAESMLRGLTANEKSISNTASKEVIAVVDELSDLIFPKQIYNFNDKVVVTEIAS